MGAPTLLSSKPPVDPGRQRGIVHADRVREEKTSSGQRSTAFQTIFPLRATWTRGGIDATQIGSRTLPNKRLNVSTNGSMGILPGRGWWVQSAKQ